ncbi:MAG: hypothetical protein IJO16_03285 [Clostridia bacterium]|nr:hypothetical protein [Clostridia bacterium]MBQ6934478.1 hypothetical protein [Clostridia bacterium]
MKKSNFVALVLGTVSMVLFALGMCMALLPKWNEMDEGIIMGLAGIILGLITVLIWRKMENKPPIKITAKTFGIILVSLVGTLTFGAGMCLCLVAEEYIYGIVAGLLGIVILFALIPMCKGLK